MINNPSSADDLAQRVNEIYFEALDIETETKREAFIEDACGRDEAVRREVIALFDLQDRATTIFRDHTPTELSATAIIDTITNLPDFFKTAGNALPDDEVGKQIGPYTLLQKIGEGGVGKVYLAEQLKPVRRQVAFKIIKAGMDTQSVVARFEAERQALALMEHPNIARVLNAGETETGRPYFVMDLVHGKKITTYCDEHALPLRQRLTLFRDVCHAIQHAHQKGIIHRDIKPSNVLVTTHDGVARPIVIDFGIAKATTGDQLTDKTINTGIGPIIGTPTYMSPEQTNLTHPDIDTRCDIYSLGVLLYELLTGRTPFEHSDLMKAGLDEMCRILREQEPPSPSAKFQSMSSTDQTATARTRNTDPRRLQTALSGDLGWIALMAMDKERDRRYETADAMAMDIEYFLDSEPVMAHPPARLYRFQKLVRRNKATFAYLTAISLVVLVGLATSTWLLFREREARISERTARESEQKLLVEADARAKIALAALLISRSLPAEADRLIEAVEIPVVEPSLEAAGVFRTLGEWNVLQNQWNKAAARFSKLVFASRVDKTDMTEQATIDLLRTGPALIVAGKIETYHSFSDEMLDHFSGTQDAVAAEQILKICLTAPPEPSILPQLNPLATLLKESMREPPTGVDIYRYAWRDFVLSLFEYRRGQYEEALPWAMKSLNSTNRNPVRLAMTHILLSMEYAKLDQKPAALKEWAIGSAALNQRLPEGTANIGDLGTYGDGFWFDWTIANLLLQEAEQQIDVR